MMRSKVGLSLLATLCCCTTACNRTQPDPNYEVIEETYIHKYGVCVPHDDWEARGEHGQVISTYKNGVTTTKSYTGGVLEGNTSYTHPHSDIVEKVETYSNGKVVKEEVFSQSGVPVQETLFQEHGKKSITFWYENGSPRSVEDYDSAGLLDSGKYYDAHHQLDGVVANGEGMRYMRDIYGQLVAKDMIQKGEMTSRTTYHPNGAPNAVTPYRNGMITGERRTYHPAGEPNTIEEWVGGKQEGMTTQFQNGEKYAEVPYIAGTKVGVERRYRNGTDVVKEIAWKNDQQHGPTTTHIGDTKQVQWYYKDKPISKGNFDNLNGAFSQ